MQVKNIVSIAKCKVIIKTAEGLTVYEPGLTSLDEKIKNYQVEAILAPETNEIHIHAKKSEAPDLEEAGYSFEVGMGME